MHIICTNIHNIIYRQVNSKLVITYLLVIPAVML